MFEFFTDIKNILDFSLRNKFNISRKNYLEKNQDKKGLFTDKQLFETEEYLVEKYNLQNFKENSTTINYLENLNLLYILDKYLTIESKENLSILDIGSKNWTYAKAEHAFFQKYSKTLSLTGIEIDSNRLYTNFFSRKEVAKFHIKQLPNTEYIEGDFLKHNKKYDYIIWILPFVDKTPIMRWGLPLAFFKPPEMLKHALKSLNDNGKLFIINQGEYEYYIQKELYKKLKATYQDIGEIKNKFFKYINKRYLTILEK